MGSTAWDLISTCKVPKLWRSVVWLAVMKNSQKCWSPLHYISLDIGSVPAKHTRKLESIIEFYFINLYFVSDRQINLFCKQIFCDAWTVKIFTVCDLWKGQKLILNNSIQTVIILRLIIYRCINKHWRPVRHYKSRRMGILHVRLFAELSTVEPCDMHQVMRRIEAYKGV